MKQYFTSTYWKGQRLLLLVFLLLHTVVAAFFISRQSITFDEMDYYAYGVKWAKGEVERTNKMYDSKTPLMVIAAIPRALRQLLDPAYKTTDHGVADILAGRYLMVLFTIIAALYLFRWIRHWFGPRSWIIPLLFFLFDPLVISFSMIITSDMASGACLLATAWHFFRYSVLRNIRQLILFSVWLAVALICKASLLFAVPLLFVLLVVSLFKDRSQSRRLLRHAAISLFLVILLLNAAYFFKGTGRPLDASEWQSKPFQRAAFVPLISSIPVPLPHSYLQALDLLQFHGDIGAGHPESTHHGTFINGKIRYQGGWWYYYLYVGMYKIPVATLLVIVAGCIFMFSGRGSFWKVHAWYFIPLLYFLVVLSYFNPFQSGFRHFLLVYPLLFMLVAVAVDYFNRLNSRGIYGVVVLLCYMLISVAVYFPWLMAYTNEFTGDKKLVFRKINDSSISYGQNRASLRKFLERHPQFEAMPLQPRPGKFIVSSTELVDFKSGRDCSWLSVFTPVAHYQYSMYIFEITPEDLRQSQQKSR